jgi:hypothetical protein
VLQEVVVVVGSGSVDMDLELLSVVEAEEVLGHVDGGLGFYVRRHVTHFDAEIWLLGGFAISERG